MRLFGIFSLLLFSLIVNSCESPVSENSPVEKKIDQHALLGTWGNLFNYIGQPLYHGYRFTADSVISYEAASGSDGLDLYQEAYACTYSDSSVNLVGDTMYFEIRNDSLFVKGAKSATPFIRGVTYENVDFENFNHTFELCDLTDEQMRDQDGNVWSFSAPDSEWGAVYNVSGSISENGTWEYSRESGIITLTTNDSQISRYRAVFVKDHIVFESSDGGSDITLRY